MNKTQAGRLLTLAWYLRTEVKPEKFDMLHIGMADSCIDFFGPFNEHPCGTSACAMGHATNIWPEYFQLMFHRQNSALLMFRGRHEFFTGPKVRGFFGLSFSEASIFHADEATPKQKAAQIEKLVGEHGWEYADV